MLLALALVLTIMLLVLLSTVKSNCKEAFVVCFWQSSLFLRWTLLEWYRLHFVQTQLEVRTNTNVKIQMDFWELLSSKFSLKFYVNKQTLNFVEQVLPFWSSSGGFASKTTQRCIGGNKGGSVFPCRRKTQLAGSLTRAESEARWAHEQGDSERRAGRATGTWRTSWSDPLARDVAHKWTRQTWSPPGAPTRAACVHKTCSESSTTLGCKLSNHYTVSTITKTIWFCISWMITIHFIRHCFNYTGCPITKGAFREWLRAA